ncbi:MAG: hypothetical protein ISR55_00250 [Bacteroidetes bacterium]|nr:hypothetical protein [Bacteroidota bacterium]MBL6962232.1 hypothetical protein [Bacteroidota bacterium]
MRKLVYFVLIVSGISACAPARFIQPLEVKQHAVSFSLGGPLFNFSDMNIPAPLSSICYGFGLKDNLTLFGSLHTTSLAFGNFQSDFGATYKFLDQEKYKPNLSACAAGNLIFNFDEPNLHFWPQIDLNAYWEHGKNNSFFFVGISNWFELAAERAHDQPSTDHWLLNPQLGYQWNTNSWSFHAELKFLAPGHSNEEVLIDFRSLTGNYGSTGLYLGVTKKF